MASEDALDRPLTIARAYIGARGDHPVWTATTRHELRAAFSSPLDRVTEQA